MEQPVDGLVAVGPRRKLNVPWSLQIAEPTHLPEEFFHAKLNECIPLGVNIPLGATEE